MKIHTIVILIVFILLSYSNLIAINISDFSFQLQVGTTKNSFKELNDYHGGYYGNSSSSSFDNGLKSQISILYKISSNFNLSLSSGYNHYIENGRMDIWNEDGVFVESINWPKWTIHSNHSAFMFYYLLKPNLIDIRFGSGLGIENVWYNEKYQDINSLWYEYNSEYSFYGFAPLLKFEVQLKYTINDHLSLIFSPSYKYCNIESVKLYSKENGDSYDNSDPLIDGMNNKVGINLSGFSIIGGIEF